MGLFDLFKSKSVGLSNVESTDVARYSEELPVSYSRDEERSLSSLRRLGDFGKQVGDIYIESKRINSNIKALRIQTNTVVTMHAQNIAAAQDLVTRVFAERAVGLKKHYDVLDKALKEDDRELIIASLQGITSIIVANPVDQIARFVGMLESKDTPLVLDF